MTPAQQTRIEKLARECLKQLMRDGLQIEPNECVTTVETLLKSLTTLAEQIIAEKDAEAAEMRAMLEQAERDRDGALQVCAEHDLSLADMLMPIKYEAQLASLRARVRELEGRVTITPEGE